MWSKALVVGMAAAACLAGAAISLGAIPGASGTISGCYSKSNGSLRVIDAESGASCAANKEAALSWSQQGPQGPPGVQGPPGPALETLTVSANSSAVEDSDDGFDLKLAHAFCPDGSVATGGGYRIGASRAVTAQVTVTTLGALSSDPIPGSTIGWGVTAIAPVGVGSWELGASAVCQGAAG